MAAHARRRFTLRTAGTLDFQHQLCARPEWYLALLTKEVHFVQIRLSKGIFVPKVRL